MALKPGLRVWGPSSVVGRGWQEAQGGPCTWSSTQDEVCPCWGMPRAQGYHALPRSGVCVGGAGGPLTPRSAPSRW